MGGININNKKTKIMKFSKRNTLNTEDSRSQTDVKSRIGQAECAFNNNNKLILTNNNISIDVRKKLQKHIYV